MQHRSLKIASQRADMCQDQSNCRKSQIQENTLSKLSGRRRSNQSLFSLLLEIESQLRKEFRNDQVEQRLKLPNRSRYFE
jgi:hypothetical protein